MARQKEPTYITENKPFPTRLRELMNEKGTTQPELADFIGVTRQTISLYCTGQSTPDIDTFVRIAEYFNVSYEYLLGKSDAKKRENINIYERTGLSDDAIENLESLNGIINGSEIEGLVDDSERILKVINFLLGDKKDNKIKSTLGIGGQFILDIGRYLFIDYESENKKSKDFISLVDKQTKRKTQLNVSIVKQSLLSEIIFQLQKWEEDIRINQKHVKEI